MMTTLEDLAALDALESKLRTILSPEYQNRYEDVQPVSMGSASLKYGSDGKVLWNEIWKTFCDLAMAGGPPHKGTLLEPDSVEKVAMHPERYAEIIEEICRGIFMVTELPASRSTVSGWVRVDCATQTMAEWLIRAITMENISVRYEGRMIELPAGPSYRIEKEIKNVITAIAKTSHYWFEHMPPAQHHEIGNLFLRMTLEFPLIQPASLGYDFDAETHCDLSCKLAQQIFQATGLCRSEHKYAGWLGLNCPSIHATIWMMRALVVSNILARREGTAIFLPINPSCDPNSEIVMQFLIRIHRLAQICNIV